MSALLPLLQDGRFHSGQELGMALGVSRASIWKHIKLLEAETGITLERVRGRGYRLPASISLLSSDCLDGLVPLRLYAQTDSTNARALALLQSGEAAPFAVLAEQQTAGRGRRGRHWHSPFGLNIYFTYVIDIQGGTQPLSGISLSVGLAVLRALESFGIRNAGLKWPNDVLVAGRKIAGILLELVGDPSGHCHVVIGIGINVNMATTEVPLDQPWTSMLAELGVPVARSALAWCVTNELKQLLHIHLRDGFTALKKHWEEACQWLGRDVELTTGTQKTVGTMLGVDDSGGLRLRIGDEERIFSGGELTLRLANDT